ncbi:hypothetical protein L6R52_14265 [Myxococcota bacterium]|nr:hypothetical protein [Myxococcota bacterium]
MRNLVSIFAVAFLGAAAVGLSGCPGSIDDPSRFIADPTCTLDVEQEIFVAKCGNASCHGGGAASSSGLDLVAEGFAAQLVDKPAVGCAGSVLVSSTAPDDSVLYTKLLASPSCGLRMPLGADPLTNEEVACVRAWIAELVMTSTTGGS